MEEQIIEILNKSMKKNNNYIVNIFKFDDLSVRKTIKVLINLINTYLSDILDINKITLDINKINLLLDSFYYDKSKPDYKDFELISQEIAIYLIKKCDIPINKRTLKQILKEYNIPKKERILYLIYVVINLAIIKYTLK